MGGLGEGGDAYSEDESLKASNEEQGKVLGGRNGVENTNLKDLPNRRLAVINSLTRAALPLIFN